MSKFTSLSIKKINKETPQAVSIHFEMPDAIRDRFRFKAGQYLTLETTINNTPIRRAYSLCSSPQSGEFSVVVKEVQEGLFSKYANQTLQEGDVLKVFPPQGNFVFEPQPNNTNTYVAFAAGSGITPVFSILKTALEQEPESTFLLVYGNKSPEDTIFMKALLELQQAHPDRFFLEFVFSRKEVEGYQFGHINKALTNYFLKNKYSHLKPAAYYLCGPEQMIEDVEATLLEQGVSKSCIHFELFTSSIEPANPSITQDGNTSLTVLLDDEETTLVMPQSKTVLEAVLANDLDAPYSCQGGICSTCIARIIEGAATMRKNQILTDAELAEGLILTCQAQPTTSVLKVDYDDV